MNREMMTLPEVARYIGVAPATLVRVLCNRGSLDGVPLPEAVDKAPPGCRHWLFHEVRQFRHALERARHQV